MKTPKQDIKICEDISTPAKQWEGSLNQSVYIRYIRSETLSTAAMNSEEKPEIDLSPEYRSLQDVTNGRPARVINPIPQTFVK